MRPGVWQTGHFLSPPRYPDLEVENIWLIYSAFAMAILPIGLALAFAPQIIRQTSFAILTSRLRWVDVDCYSAPVRYFLG